ncbi:hypothetical protein IP70_12000 [alpha proteobacterium AAP38]|jgi:hypothetical protein|uniref:hypothetical protein n=1 Tax=Niveispirillum sp. TaxID=1917217 RepID=UPI0006B9B098|nr:hypothetical protein IP70_12000 [alpha proteobacterium AAP38]MBJ7416113.1 hypothetical protein [Niveispirillum sp.]
MPRYGDLVDMLFFLPGWASILVVVLTITWTVCMVGIALGKTGRNPLWAMAVFLFFPLLTVGLWIVALSRWPRLDQKP